MQFWQTEPAARQQLPAAFSKGPAVRQLKMRSILSSRVIQTSLTPFRHWQRFRAAHGCLADSDPRIKGMLHLLQLMGWLLKACR